MSWWIAVRRARNNADLAADAGVYVRPTDALRRLRGVGGHEHVFTRRVDRLAIGDRGGLLLDDQSITDTPITLIEDPVGQKDIAELLAASDNHHVCSRQLLWLFVLGSGCRQFGEQASSDAMPDVVELQCPDDYAVLKAGSPNRYRFYGPPQTWAGAAAACLADQASTVLGFTHLAVIGDLVEFGALYAAAIDTPVWIGLSDTSAEGTFTWVTDEPVPDSFVSTAWGTGEPNGGSDENCVEISPTGSFRDAACEMIRSYFCECDQFRTAGD
jgi:hypothetical protein